ncbi:MAG: hypothetical protein ABW067_15610 [Rhizobacter sp.]
MSRPKVAFTALTDEIDSLVGALAARYLAVFEPSDQWPDAQAVQKTVDWYASALYGDSERAASEKAAMEIVLFLAPDASQKPAWWGTALGRAVAWWGGLPAEVQQTTAAHVLGVTRQRVTTLIADSQLKVAEGTNHVTRESLMDRLHRTAR